MRATYEPLLDGLAERLLLSLPSWLADDDATDHWARGHRGMIARRLLEELSDRSAPAMAEPVEGPRWRKLRARLRQD